MQQLYFSREAAPLSLTSLLSGEGSAELITHPALDSHLLVRNSAMAALFKFGDARSSPTRVLGGQSQSFASTIVEFEGRHYVAFVSREVS